MLPLEAEKTQTCPSFIIKESATSKYQVAMSAFVQWPKSIRHFVRDMSWSVWRHLAIANLIFYGSASNSSNHHEWLVDKICRIVVVSLVSLICRPAGYFVQSLIPKKTTSNSSWGTAVKQWLLFTLCHIIMHVYSKLPLFDLSFPHELYPDTHGFYPGLAWVVPGVWVLRQWYPCR